LELQRFASRVARSREAISRQPLACGTARASGIQVAGLRGGERTVDRSTAMSHRVSGNRESGGCVLVDIANRETPMESMVEGMW
jgi:hypothetical protein